MPNRLEPLNLMDWTGGLNLRRNQFQLAENESPDMLNVDVDPRGGIVTRRGWTRWNLADIVDLETTTWQPRNAAVHNLANGEQVVYVVNSGTIYSAGTDRVFSALAGINGTANPHDADFAAWGDDIYFTTGMTGKSYKRHLMEAPIQLVPTFSEVDAPTPNTMPQAEFVCTHGGYLFCAVTQEATVNHNARVRWSHPSKPDSWRTDDYIDIDAGGGKITGLISFRDHLLIFKTNSMWALYGYDEDSWQLIKVSFSVGCPGVTAVTRSETGVYFFSSSDRGGIYGYSGESPVYMSEALRPALEEILNYDNVFVSWAGRRLWVAVPWIKGGGSTTQVSTAFVFSPDIGEGGAWTMYRCSSGALGLVVDGSDINSKYPLASLWSSFAAVMIVLDYIDDAYDSILEPNVLGTDAGAYLSTDDGKDIIVSGMDPPGEAFETYYRTRWLHADWPDRKKSWRRPTIVVRQVPQDVDLIIESFRDYNETVIHRSRTVRVVAEGSKYWTATGFAEKNVGGFDWTPNGKEDPTGADWGPQIQGSRLQRAGSMGLARAVQIRIRPSPNTLRRWGVDAVVAKFKMRRFR